MDTIGNLIDKLTVVNIRIWMCEDIKRNAQASDNEISKATKVTNIANQQRNDLIQEIDEKLNELIPFDASKDNVNLLVKHRNVDILLEYLITIPDFIKDNAHFKKSIQKKLDEFTDVEKNENYIETAHMMVTIRKLNDIIKDM